MQDNQKFWQEQAKKYQDDIKSVNFDPIQEQMEVETLASLLQESRKICDLGCGIGQTVFALKQKGIGAEFYGMDFTKEMIEVAKQTQAAQQVADVVFFHKSATDHDLCDMFDFKFDTVISKRLLINVKGEDKYKAVENIYNLLEENGRYVMVECFSEPLAKTNVARSALGLEPISMHHFNEYLDEDFIGSIGDKFIVEQEIDTQSSYYFISRVLNAYEAQKRGVAPDYGADINMAALKLFHNGINPVSGYAPEKLLVLRKKS